MSEDVTVVLSGYKRSYATLEQYKAIKNQTVKDIKIMFWVNFPDNKTSFPEEVISNCQSIISTSNYGVWGRFIESLHAQTESEERGASSMTRVNLTPDPVGQQIPPALDGSAGR